MLDIIQERLAEGGRNLDAKCPPATSVEPGAMERLAIAVAAALAFPARPGALLGGSPAMSPRRCSPSAAERWR